MSDTTSAPRSGVRTVKVGLLALALAALAAIGLAPQASADFTSAQCGGINTAGNGASFAKGAQEVFNFNFKTSYCAGSGLNVVYTANGSGAGVEGAQLREGASRFWGTDDPPAPAAVALMNSGAKKETVEGKPKVVPDGVEGNEGKVHVFPIAAGAVAPLVNLPEGCSPEPLEDRYRTVSKKAIEDTPALKGILRIRFTKKKFEKVWAGEENEKWSQAFPLLGSQGGACDKPIIRVVRFDKSGTTFAFKDYLRTIDPTRGWTTTFEADNREWPSAGFGFPASGEEKSQCGIKVPAPGGKETDDTKDFLTSACGNGNGELVKKLIATEGSIGYSDIATARGASPTLAVDASQPNAPTTPYWTPIQNGTIAVGSIQEEEGKGFTEPTANETDGFKTTAASTPGQKGSNCLTVAFQNAPSTTLGDWSKTSGVNSSNGFGICTLTYVMAFDDNAPVFKNTAEEEGKARTVKDYLESVLSDSAQGQLFGADYAPVPLSLLPVARKGVAEIGWNKSSAGGSDPGGDPGTNPRTNPSGGGGGGATVVVSNQFSIPKKTISSKTGSATFSVKLPGAGKLAVLGTAKAGKKKIKVGNVTLTVGKAGTYSVTLKPTGAAKQLLSQKGSLKVNLTFTFSPVGGAAKSSTSAVTLKLAAKSGKQG